MKGMKNNFASKFQLLNSQENSDEIIWSSDSEYETSFKENSANLCNKIINRKRKRANKKQSNTSNLDISYTKSPDITESSQTIAQVKCDNAVKSPIISAGKTKNVLLSSPILFSKRVAPLSSVKIQRKLFSTKQGSNYNRSNSEGCYKFKRCCEDSSTVLLKKSLEDNKDNQNRNDSVWDLNDSDQEDSHINNEDKIGNINENSSHQLIDKIRSYFDSHFSSESTQHSISEYETESSVSNDVDITTSLTPIPVTLEAKSSTDSLSCNQDVKSKKVKYKKDGLSYRLNVLLKKQKSTFSLWHHEKYLATISNFVIPKEEFFVFRIQNISSKYGVSVLQAVDDNNKKYFILINNSYVNNNLLENNAIIKLYKPFRIIDYDVDCKLVLNVFKFECTGFGS